MRRVSHSYSLLESCHCPGLVEGFSLSALPLRILLPAINFLMQDRCFLMMHFLQTTQAKETQLRAKGLITIMTIGGSQYHQFQVKVQLTALLATRVNS